ncbi:hypothetical protein WJX74_003035 [Apatococcus lobatus]|uniref:NADPH oxidase n=1 Tax=Apatococcus lobatus TaxID=904363 RepID=A0AAW1RT78_9CHLO
MSSSFTPLGRLREDLQDKRKQATGSLPVVECHTYQDVQDGLQKLSTLPEEQRAATTGPAFDRPRIFSRESRENIRQAAGSLVSYVSKPIKSLVVRLSEEKAREEAQFNAERAQLLQDFRATKGGKTDLNLSQFKSALAVRGEVFAEALFRKMDAGKRGFVSDEELVNAILTLHCDSLENRIAFTFELLDTDSMGALNRKSLASMLQVKLELLIRSIKLAGINLKLPREDRKAELQEIKRQTASLARAEKLFVQFLHHFSISNPTKFFWLTIFCLAQIAGFVVAWTQNDFDMTFKALGWGFPIAKASAGAIQVVVALWLFPVARGMLTFIRSTPLKRAIPVDQSIQIHKFLAYCFFFWGWLHSLAHFVNSARATQPRHLTAVYSDLYDYHHLTCGNSTLAAETITRGDFKAAGLPLASNSLAPTLTLSSYYQRQVQVTGVLLLGVMTIGYLWAMKYPRQSRLIRGTFLSKVFNSFSWFYATHLVMTFAVVTLLIIHPWPGLKRMGPARVHCSGPAKSSYGDKTFHGVTWYYLFAGVVVFLIERTLRTWRRAAWDVSLEAVKLHSNNIIELRLTNPRRTNLHMTRRFQCKPGQYCFLNIPKLSVLEWHPFSITSSPFDDHISFHIRAQGDWTKALKSIMQELTGESGEWTRFGKKLSHQTSRLAAHKSSSAAAASEGSSIELEDVNPFAAAHSQRISGGREPGTSSGPVVLPERPSVPDLEVGFAARSLGVVPRVAIDGPFGAPAQNFNDYEVLLLVGAGVGITPFASVLRTLVKEHEMARCRRCGLANQHLFMPKKVYFHWITREQQAPTWFRSTLEAIQSNEDVRTFLDIHIHFTSALAPDDLRASIVKVAQELHHREHGFDILCGCGLSLPISFGRPNWDKIFGNIAADHPGQLVGTFYCGGAVLGKQLKGLCRTWNSKAGGHGFSLRRQSVADAAGQAPLIKTAAKFDFFRENF